MTGLFGFPFGVPIRTDDTLVETVQHSRSPARARRRAKLGHRQHHRTQPMHTATRTLDGVLVMHPELLDATLTALRRFVARAFDDPAGDADADEGEEERADLDQDMDCGLGPDGGCSKAGSEECDWDCGRLRDA